MNETPEFTQNETSVRNCYQRLMDAWNTGSSSAFAAVFAEDGHFVAFDGTYFKGRREIDESHRVLFEKWLKGSRLTGTIQTLRFLSNEIALMHTTGGTVMPGQTRASPERDSIQTLVLIKQDGSWFILAFQNTRIRPIGQGFGGVIAWLFADKVWNLLNPKRHTRFQPNSRA
jgi:uncharacterized protein (TIGR02246 family)